jgi:hypothetical protein
MAKTAEAPKPNAVKFVCEMDPSLLPVLEACMTSIEESFTLDKRLLDLLGEHPARWTRDHVGAMELARVLLGLAGKLLGAGFVPTADRRRRLLRSLFTVVGALARAPGGAFRGGMPGRTFANLRVEVDEAGGGGGEAAAPPAARKLRTVESSSALAEVAAVPTGGASGAGLEMMSNPLARGTIGAAASGGSMAADEDAVAEARAAAARRGLRFDSLAAHFGESAAAALVLHDAHGTPERAADVLVEHQVASLVKVALGRWHLLLHCGR